METIARATSRIPFDNSPTAVAPEWRERRGPAPDPIRNGWIESSPYPDFVVDEGCRVHDMNFGACAALDRGDPLRLDDGALRARDPESHRRFSAAVTIVSCDRRARYCLLASRADRPAVALLPMDDGRHVLVRLERNTASDSDAVAHYAASIGLTQAETRILELLASGCAPKRIGSHCQTAESTVRTQIKSLLAKSGDHGIRELLMRLARLPSLRVPASR